MQLYLNGRFLAQPFSGVQRYATELIRALDKNLSLEMADRKLIPTPVLLIPSEAENSPFLSSLKTITWRVVPGASGHVWDQSTLFHASSDGILVSLCNSGPVRHRNHILCLHDANIYDLPNAFSWKYRVLHKQLRPQLAARAAQLISVSRYSAERLSAHIGTRPGQYQIIPNSAEHITSYEPDDRVLEEHGLKSGEYFLSVGSRTPNKNSARLVEAFAKLQSDKKLVLVGATPCGLVEEKIEDLDGVVVTGSVSDEALAAFYQHAHAAVFPSFSEGFGIPALEAMLLGAPVVAARSGARPEVIGNNALWFDPFDTNDICRAMQMVSQLDLGERQDLVDSAIEHAHGYRWERSALQLEHLIRDQISVMTRRAA